MNSFLANMLRQIFMISEEETILAVLPKQDASDTAQFDRMSGQFLPSSLIPNAEFTEISDGEEYVNELELLLAKQVSTHILLVPPWIPNRSLSDKWRQDHPGVGVETIAIQKALSHSSVLMVAAILPLSFLTNEGDRECRETLQHIGDSEPEMNESISLSANVSMIIHHDHPLIHFGIESIHPAFRAATVLLQKSKDASRTLKFFKYKWSTDFDAQSVILNDLATLIKREGGETQFGYVYRENLESGSMWSFDLHSPKTKQKQQSLSKLGELRRLEDLFHINRGLNIAQNGDMIRPQMKPGYIHLLHGKNVTDDGLKFLEDLNRFVPRDDVIPLQYGDICVRGIGREKVTACLISEQTPNYTTDHTIFTLRAKRKLQFEELEYYLSYLRSTVAWHFLQAKGTSITLTERTLKNLPVPEPNMDIVETLKILAVAQENLVSWQDDIHEAKRDLFKFQNENNSKQKLLSIGRQIRQRVSAAQQIDHLPYRIRTQFPHPLAYRWRTIEACSPNIEGYDQVLETAEAIAYFMCALSMAVVQSSEERIGYLDDMAHRITHEKRGTSFGDWFSILTESRDSKKLKTLSEEIEFGEVLRFLDYPDVEKALSKLKGARNDRSHGRGPKSKSAIQDAFETELINLKLIYQAAEFLTDYSLLIVEDVRPDSITNTYGYSYRELTGDHSLVPIKHEGTSSSIIEKDSLYLRNNRNQLLLLRPFIQRIECPQCESVSTFYLDRHNVEENTCTLKSIEHNHHFEDSSMVSAFKHIGLIK
jgi:hypothetical protein